MCDALPESSSWGRNWCMVWLNARAIGERYCLIIHSRTPYSIEIGPLGPETGAVEVVNERDEAWMMKDSRRNTKRRRVAALQRAAPYDWSGFTIRPCLYSTACLRSRSSWTMFASW